MKKFYFLIFTGVFMLTSFASKAQTVYTSISANPSNWTLDDGRFWLGGVAPGGGATPGSCNNCAIYINSSVTVVPDNGTSTAFPIAGSAPSLSHVILLNSTLKINGSVTITINTYLELQNTAVIIGSDISTAAAVILNDQVYLDVNSSVQLGNNNTRIDVNNIASNPINGPYTRYTGGIKDAAIISASTNDPHGYTFTLNAFGDGSSLPGGNFSEYDLNCDASTPPVPSNICAAGVVYGPATTTLDAVKGVIFTQSAVLPVVLSQFLASKNADASIKLSWATSQEINSSSFEVERSADQGNWQNIGSVKAKGYSSTTANYSFTDQLPGPGNNYYRLKMVDLDGKFKYSQVVAVTSEKDGRTLVIYSNPFSDQIRMKVNVSKAQNLSLTVTDIIGKTYLKQSYNAQAGDNLINLVPAGAARGMYILHIQGSTYVQTVKLAKQ